MVGRQKLSAAEIYDSMLMLNDNKQKITISLISIMLGCSTRTVHRNMTNELRREKELLNQQL